jgi:hypothetical protein
MTISYHYGMGEELSHNMAVQAQMLHEHANDLLTAGNALVSEGFQGLGGNAYIDSLNRLCNAVFDITDTITRHGGAGRPFTAQRHRHSGGQSPEHLSLPR